MKISHAKKLQTKLNKDFKEISYLNGYRVILEDSKSNKYPHQRANMYIVFDKDYRDAYNSLFLEYLSSTIKNLNILALWHILEDHFNKNKTDFILTIF